MSEGTPKAIEMKGIVRNATKIGAQDGQAEDLINLRFMDGSWRASGDGRLVHTMSGAQYEQLYVHTNVYHHLLGVNEDTTTHVRTLYWFANIDTDGVTFTALNTPVALTEVHGDLTITQTGHLLSIIDGEDDFEHFVFKTSTSEYIEVNMDVNGKATDRKLYPFGQVHFNLYEPFNKNIDSFDHAIVIKTDGVSLTEDNSVWNVNKDIPVSDAITAFGKAKKKNLFVNPFLVCGALRLYDGSFAYATNTVLLYPRQPSSSGRRFYDTTSADYRTFNDHEGKRVSAGINFTTTNGKKYYHTICYCDNDTNPSSSNFYMYPTGTIYPWDNQQNFKDDLPSFMCGLHYNSNVMTDNHSWITVVLGSDLVCSITDELQQILKSNADVFQSFCIFVTPEVDIFKSSKETAIPFKGTASKIEGAPVFLERKKDSVLIKELMSMPFYLLKEYSNVDDLLDSPVVNIDTEELLNNIVQQDRLPIEASARATYIPKVSYMYNNRLHLADYKTYPFFGYPLDMFHLNNHSVKEQESSWYKNVLPNLTDNDDQYHKFSTTEMEFPSTTDWFDFFAFAEVDIETSQGTQKVVRYIEPYDTTTPVEGRADFIESLNPLITYPDARAKRMRIVVMKSHYSVSDYTEWYAQTFDLKPHPYLNMAYHISDDLKPITLPAYSTSGTEPVPTLPTMQNTEEYFPNGLKVSKTDNPMFFPVENAYQVGSAKILALCSNAIAVGTGQTGAAPLYVFCTDGIYALFVDASGQMTYSNSRVLARDVCNNPRSVTPIDAGVVFTTDRGLMMIAGEQVEEIGQPAEGDVLHFVDFTKVDYSKYASDALTKIAGLPSSLCDTTDFLTYLQGAIVNYNHNMRELIVTNPSKSYSYVLDREGNWSRRDYTAAEYVNNYPTSYRVTSGGQFYKLDDEGDANTSLEHPKEADNQIFYLSNVIKLDSIGFKQAYRFVVRGYFDTQPIATISTIGGRQVYITGDIISGLIVGESVRLLYKNKYGENHWVTYGNENIVSVHIYDMATNEDVTTTCVEPGSSRYYEFTKQEPAVGIVVEGSYDGIKFAPLGFNRKSGKFTNIGCHVSHTDVRFYRVILCGQVTGKTRIDYMEMSASGSVLNTKIR